MKSLPDSTTGTIRIWNTTTSALEPVVGVKVRGRRWFTYGYGYTGTDGVYVLDETFTGDIHYSLVMENIKGFKIWGDMAFLSPAIYEFADTIPTGIDLNCWHGLQVWRWAAANNATDEYLEFCDQNNITKPPTDLRIWVNTLSPVQGSAAMLKRTYGWAGFNTESQVANFFLNMGIAPIPLLGNLISLVAPDISIHVSQSTTLSPEMYGLVYHECAHASHWSQVGNNYWIDYIQQIIANPMNYPYGNGNETNSGIIIVGESWGFHTGSYLAIQKFGNNSPRVNSQAVFEAFEPLQVGSIYNSIVRGGSYWKGWIVAGIINDLIDSNVDLVRTGYNDNFSGYTMEQVFNALDSDVRDMQQFKARILSENG